MKNYVKQRYAFILSVITAFVVFLPILCQAEKPTYKAKHELKDKETQINLNVILPEYKLNEEAEWIVLNCEDQNASHFLQKGEPALYSFTYFISIPEDAKVKNVTIKPQQRPFMLNKPLIPIPEPVPIGSPLKPPIPDEEIYNSSEPYPKKDFDFQIAKQGSTRMLVLTLYPFKYIGESKTLLVYDYMDIEIILEAKHWISNANPRNAVDKNLKLKLLNPEEAFFQGGAR